MTIGSVNSVFWWISRSSFVKLNLRNCSFVHSNDFNWTISKINVRQSIVQSRVVEPLNGTISMGKRTVILSPLIILRVRPSGTLLFDLILTCISRTICRIFRNHCNLEIWLKPTGRTAALSQRKKEYNRLVHIPGMEAINRHSECRASV